MAASTFQCSCCGAILEGPPLAWHFDSPIPYKLLPKDSRDQRAQISEDQCIIDGEHFFVRGLVELPVLDGEGPFAWGVWVSLSEANFERASRLWRDPARVNEPPYFGWFCTSLPGYPETLHLKTHVHTRAVGLRPRIELEHTDHPLAFEQRQGITTARVREIAEHMYHLKAAETPPKKRWSR